ncbi:transmembrane protein 272-like isoform X1 [Callorhinchus milii]|nr:transmembrane protein 272-like isoform X1 [Callorhinchus milii]
MMSAMSIAYITIGTVYLNSCTQQHLIPIYLIVSGSFSLFLIMISCVHCSPSDGENLSQWRDLSRCWKTISSLFSFIWFLTGNVWIYSIYEPDYIHEDSALYCNRTLYLFAFWMTTITYTLLALVLVLGCCGLLCVYTLQATACRGQQGCWGERER